MHRLSDVVPFILFCNGMQSVDIFAVVVVVVSRNID